MANSQGSFYCSWWHIGCFLFKVISRSVGITQSLYVIPIISYTMSPYKDPERQREACRVNMQKSRAKKKREVTKTNE